MEITKHFLPLTLGLDLINERSREVEHNQNVGTKNNQQPGTKTLSKGRNWNTNKRLSLEHNQNAGKET
jgi:hypothetical protein